MSEPIWHSLEINHIFNVLETSEDGLSSITANSRLKQHGLNEIPKVAQKTPGQVLIEQFTSPLIYILVIVAIITFAIHHYIDTAVILFIVISNGLIGYFQEIKASKSLEKLDSFLTVNTKVLRDDELAQIPAKNLVPGDIVIIEAGLKIPADLRIIESIDLHIEESTLTGESLPSEKNIKTYPENTITADQLNIAHSGTFVTTGRGRGVVVATGLKTEFGQIANSIQHANPPDSPLEKELNDLSKQLIIVILITMVALLFIGLWRKLNVLDMFLTSINLAVSAIPEGLPAVMTITLAMGVRAMAQKKAIIRYLPAVETLGAVTLVATDKTGTLTKDQMSVEKIYMPNIEYEIQSDGYNPEGNISIDAKPINPLTDSNLKRLLTIAALCNDSSLITEKDEWKIIGDPTEGSLIVVAAKAKLMKAELEEIYPRLDEIPFHTTKRFMATLHKTKKGNLVAIKGASEEVIKFCQDTYLSGKKTKLSVVKKQEILAKVRALSAEGYRVLMLAQKTNHPSDELLHKELNDATFLGLCAMKDSPRREVPRAIQQAHSAGIRVAMITGDHALTAQSVASSIGIVNEPITGQNTVVTGDMISKFNPSQLDELTKYCNIYSRVSPLQKLKLVEQFQKKGHIVAVTGDGINDSAALKQADVGIAMGITGTDISREAASMVLANDNFATIISAIAEGRAIYNNIKRVLLYLLSTNIGEIFVIMFAIIIGFRSPENPKEFILPVVAIQILWINLITDGFAVIPLSLEPKHGDIMKQPPRKPNSPILDNVMKWRILLVSITMAIGTLLLFNWELNHSSLKQAQTVAFLTMIFFQLINMFNCRSLSQSILTNHLFKNFYVLIAFSGAFILSIFAIYLPALQKIFYTTDISFVQWVRAMLVSLTIIIVVELEKWYRNNPGYFNFKINKLKEDYRGTRNEP